MTIRLRHDLIRSFAHSSSPPALIPSPTFTLSRHPPRTLQSRRPRLHPSPSTPPPISPTPSTPTSAFIHQSHLPFRISSNPNRPPLKQTPTISCMVCKNSPVVVGDPLPAPTRNDARPSQTHSRHSSFVGVSTTTSTTTRAGLIAVGLSIELLDHHTHSTQPILMDYQPVHSSSSSSASSASASNHPQHRHHDHDHDRDHHHNNVTVESTLSDSSHPTQQSHLPPSPDRAFEQHTALSTSTVTTSSEVSAPHSPVATKHHTSDPLKPPQTQPSLTFRTAVVCIPHPEKAKKGGEDAFFVQNHSLGVFDGVGGWASIGVDAGLYSKELARLTAEYVSAEGPNNVVDALKYATEKNHAIGSSTACVVGLDADRLVGVNLGDSGLIVIRQGAIVYRTTEQQHYFNCPYQIGTDSLDSVDAGRPVDVKLQHGDCIIMGTDGLWDNVFPSSIVHVVVTAQQERTDNATIESPAKSDTNRIHSSSSSDRLSQTTDCSMTNEAEEAQLIAQELAECALKVAKDDRGSSPFAVNAQNAGHLFLGGKIDDITIVTALVVDPEVEQRAHGVKSSSALKDAQTGSSENKRAE